MKLWLQSRLKTIKAHKLVEDFTEEAPDVTLASVMTTVVMLISFLFREEAILKLRTNLRMHLRRFMGLGFTCDECAYDFALFNNFINKKITLRMKLRLKSRLKTIKAH